MAERPDSDTSGLSIGVLGPLTVHRNGERILLGGRREAAVLVALVLQRHRVITADALVAAVWPDARPAQPQPALQAHISHLRRRLDPDGEPGLRTTTVERVGPGYTLRIDESAVDAWRFEDLITGAARRHNAAAAGMLTEALSLWRGTPLAGFADEEWAKPTAEQWSQLHAVARERLYAARLDEGESALLVPELESFVAEAPLREERWRLLALALYRSQRQADALAALRRVRTLLADELGVDPGSALRSLEAEILSQESSLDRTTPLAVTRDSPPVKQPGNSGASDQPAVPTGSAVSITGGSSTATTTPTAATVGPTDPPVRTPPKPRPTSRGDTTVLVEREGELAVITQAISAALDGDGGVVLIEGPAGIGKTQLLREVRFPIDGRAENATVLSARGSQLEREYGFGVVRQLFEPLVTGLDQQTIFAGAAGAARGVFSAHQEPGSQAGDTAFGVLHGLYWLAANLAATNPLIITIDDVQWCDVGSLRFLGFLAHRLEELPIAVVVTLRTGEQHDHDDLLAEVVSEASVLVVAPKPLTDSGVNELVGRRLGQFPDDAFVAACRRTTGGNPLLLRQLLRALESDGIKPTSSNVDTVRAIGSRAVSSLVLRRFARMSSENRAVAGAVAVLGDNATLPLIAQLTSLPEAAVGSAIGALSRAELLRDEYPLDFVHPLVRDAVYSDVPLGQRELQHAQAAALLTENAAPAEQVAAHLLKIPPRGDSRTVEVLMAAAARSVARGAPDGAVTYLERALAEPAGPDREPNIYLELGRVVTMTDIPAALIHLSAARDRLHDMRERAHAAVLLGRVEIFGGARGSSRRTAESMLHQLPPELNDERQWLQAISRVSAQMHLLDPVTGPLPEVVGNGPGAVSLASALSWDITRAGTDRSRAVELATFALAGNVLDDVDQGFLGVVARLVLEMAEAAPPHQWDDALASAYRKGSLFAVLGAQLWGGHTHWLRGDLDEALQWLRNSTEQIGRWGAPQIGQTYTDAFTIEVLLDRGDLAGAQALLAAERPYWDSVSESHTLLLAARARVLFQRGLLEQTLGIHDRIAELTDGIDNPAWKSWQENRAQVLVAVGRWAEAVEIIERDVGFAQRWGTSLGLGRTLRILGMIRDDGIDELREAVAVLQPGNAKLELAKAKAALGEKLIDIQLNPPAEAIAQLQAAYLLAAECGARGLQDRIGQLLDHSGLPIPDPPRRVNLTSTEQRIVEMSLDGAFDQEIAQALYITTPTVRQTLDAVRRRVGAADADQFGVAAGH